MLCISAGVTGGIIGRRLFGIGLALVGQGANILLPFIVTAAVGASVDWITVRKLEQP